MSINSYIATYPTVVNIDVNLLVIHTLIMILYMRRLKMFTFS